MLKPSGYDVVIRNSLAINKLNRRMDKADPKKRDALIDEKERLMQEMWKACPHESITQCDEVQTAFGGTVRMRLCTSCGLDETSRNGRFRILTRRKKQFISRPSFAGFRDTLRETLRRTGINI